MEHKSDGDTDYNWCNSVPSPKDWYRDWRTWKKKDECEDNPNYNIVEIGQNTKKSPGDLRSHAVTQAPVENQLTLVGKTLKWVTLLSLMAYQTS